MKQHISISFLLLSLVLILTSCFRDVFCVDGSGDRITDKFAIAEFSGIELQEAAHVYIIQDTFQEVMVTGRENILDRLQTDVKGGVWEIDLGRDCFNDLDLEIDIRVKDLNEIHLSGSGTIIVEEFLNQDNLDLSVTGSGRIELNGFTGTEDVDVRISGSGDIISNEIFPALSKMDIEITGSGVFDGYPMVCKDLDAKISGSGDMYVTVEEYMDVRITGSGDLHYKGNPLIDASITGSGKIIDEN